eukprot:TRINITY_DN32687_c0_g1_i1.p1 TRINITY_DN32687_c0_g1~~TRINITY_DN32687_c0_g1_i1.p1  ORF type:complete len:321 (+),score=64.68 TRINITY_DN32687_c0_g1_i1:78-965(+)
MEEAKETVVHYRSSKGVESEINESAVIAGKYLVKRLPDKKVLKSVKYSPPDLQNLVNMMEDASSTVMTGVLQEPDALASVAAFHEMFEVPVVETGPCLPSKDRCQLRVSLLQEELDELKEAITSDDLVECADAFADLQYVLSGAILEFGLHRRFKAMFDEVHRSNMSKACTTMEEAKETVVHYRSSKGVESEINESAVIAGKYLVKRLPDKKVLKSVKYSPPDLRHLVEHYDAALGANDRHGDSSKMSVTQVASPCRSLWRGWGISSLKSFGLSVRKTLFEKKQALPHPWRRHGA